MAKNCLAKSVRMEKILDSASGVGVHFTIDVYLRLMLSYWPLKPGHSYQVKDDLDELLSYNVPKVERDLGRTHIVLEDLYNEGFDVTRSGSGTLLWTH